jgi:3'-phosphoadenosine 5'-phosphosulfate sulfotransferase (PAPS reductase)/FAD synthetase
MVGSPLTPIERETFLLHADTDEYRARLTLAQENIRETFARYRRPCAAFSGGKDSLMMLHLILQQHPETMIFHWDYGPAYMPRDTEREILNIAHQAGATTIRCETTQQYVQKGRTAQGVLGKVLYGRMMPALKAEGYDCTFVGLRAEESGKRKRRTKSLFETGPMPCSFPIRHLTARDIWAYIVSYDLQYCSHYDRYGPLEGYESVRFCTYFDPEFAKLGRSNVDGVLMPEFRNI